MSTPATDRPAIARLAAERGLFFCPADLICQIGWDAFEIVGAEHVDWLPQVPRCRAFWFQIPPARATSVRILVFIALVDEGWVMEAGLLAAGGWVQRAYHSGLRADELGRTMLRLCAIARGEA